MQALNLRLTSTILIRIVYTIWVLQYNVISVLFKIISLALPSLQFLFFGIVLTLCAERLDMTDYPDIRRILLPNSLQLVCRDASRPYFGDYLLVRVILTLSIPLEQRFFANEADLRVAQLQLPDPLVYTRTSERMGVPTADVDKVRSVIVDDLLRNAGGYLGLEQFPSLFIQAELKRARSGRKPKGDLHVFRGA